MAGPRIGGRRPISWRLAIVVAVVALFASNAWLKGIFGYGEIATDIPFLLFGVILFFTWRVNRNAANRQSELLGSARFGDRADVRKLEVSGDLLIGRSAKLGKLLRYDGAAHLLTMAPPLWPGRRHDHPPPAPARSLGHLHRPQGRERPHHSPRPRHRPRPRR